MQMTSTIITVNGLARQDAKQLAARMLDNGYERLSADMDIVYTLGEGPTDGPSHSFRAAFQIDTHSQSSADELCDRLLTLGYESDLGIGSDIEISWSEIQAGRAASA